MCHLLLNLKPAQAAADKTRAMALTLSVLRILPENVVIRGRSVERLFLLRMGLVVM